MGYRLVTRIRGALRLRPGKLGAASCATAKVARRRLSFGANGFIVLRGGWNWQALPVARGFTLSIGHKKSGGRAAALQNL